MRQHLVTFSQLWILCQNVNRNYVYMDTLLASLTESYDLLFIQEPPWQLIRSAPSSCDREGEDVIGAPNNPNWGLLVRPSGLDLPPRVVVYFHKQLSGLRPGFRRELADHRDILIFSLGLGAEAMMLANVYSDSRHVAIDWLHDQLPMLPNLHLMCSDFNVRHRDWDPSGPLVNAAASRLVASASARGMSISTPVEVGPTHFPPQDGLTPTVIDLMFLKSDWVLRLAHSILPDDRGTSDHAPLVIDVPAPGSEVLVTRWSLKRDSDEEVVYLAAVLEGFSPLLEWQGDLGESIEEVTSAISAVLLKAWSDHAKESRITKHSKEWWNLDCSSALDVYRASRSLEDWKEYRRTIKVAKHEFFGMRIYEVAVAAGRPWDLIAWARQRNP